MTKRLLLFVNFCWLIISINLTASNKSTPQIGLKDALQGKFLIGVAMNADQITGVDFKGQELIKKNFNSIVAENCMKSENIQPIENCFNFDMADKFVKFGVENNMFIIGHTLIWHEQAPNWFFKDDANNDVSRDVLIERMKKHITTVVSHYKGQIKGWDVVNEALNEDGTYRATPYYKIIGKDYIKFAFEFAHQADPEAELYYNDFSLENYKKREGAMKIVKELQQAGIKISAVGMQGHMTMDFPTMGALEKSILDFSTLGVKVMITELDMTILPNPDKYNGAEVSKKYAFNKKFNPYPTGIPDSVAQKINNRYSDVFRILLKYQDKISRVTLWGLTDGNSWRNDWPIKGRTDYPLLFNRNYTPKPIVNTIIQEANK